MKTHTPLGKISFTQAAGLFVRLITLASQAKVPDLVLANFLTQEEWTLLALTTMIDNVQEAVPRTHHNNPAWHKGFRFERGTSPKLMWRCLCKRGDQEQTVVTLFARLGIWYISIHDPDDKSGFRFQAHLAELL